jgi:(R,R)-butanediol dehydrogenase/meso-butanediol dehydrogenase/diacetyl reductase
MRAVAITNHQRLEIVHKPDPTAGPGDVVVAVERCGICGSDIHMLAARMMAPGTVMGHEFAGTVVEVGADVTTIAEGSRVAVLPSARCGQCRLCLEGRTQLCLDQANTAVGLGRNDGAYAEFVRTPARACHVLPPEMSPEQGALVEPYAVALHAVRRSRVISNRDAAAVTAGVIGAGPIGLMTIAALRAAGVERIAVAERSSTRADVAARMGATAVVDDATRLTSAVTEELDVVFECAGVPQTPDLAMQNVRIGGEVVLVGVTEPGQQLGLTGVLWIVKEIDLHPCLGYTDEEFGEAVRAVATGIVDPATIVSDIRPLDRAQASFDELIEPGGPVKILLSPEI